MEIIEEWRRVVGYDTYEVSSIGRVRSLDRWVAYSNGGKHFYKGMILKHGLRKGYPIVMLPDRVPRNIHRLMAKAFLNVEDGQDVDHIDGNRSNNLLSNLRVCARMQNTCNINKHRDNTSGYKGVFWQKLTKKWAAQIVSNKKQIYLGTFTSKEDAALAYDRAAVKYHAEFARTNLSLGLL